MPLPVRKNPGTCSWNAGLQYLFFFSKSLAHFSPFFPHLTGGGSNAYLPWMHRDLTDEGSPKKYFLFSDLSDRTRSHISEKFNSGTFWQLPRCYIVTFPSFFTSDFCCSVFLLLAPTVAGLLCVLLESSASTSPALGCAPHRRLSWGHIIGLFVFQPTNNPVATLSLKGSFYSLLQDCHFFYQQLNSNTTCYSIF